MKTTLIAIAALAAVVATPALGADVIPEEVPPAADWTAFHIGVGGGGNYALADGESETGFLFFPFAIGAGETSGETDDFGAFGTAEAGFDFQVNRLVIGALANYDFGKTKVDDEGDGLILSIGGPETASVESEWKIGDSWAVGGRLGFLLTEGTLVYALGGYTEAKIKSSVSFEADTSDFGFEFDDSNWENGWFAGGGIEALLTDNISLKGEYRYTDFGNIEREDSGACADILCIAAASQSADITVHSIRAVLSFRLGIFN